MEDKLHLQLKTVIKSCTIISVLLSIKKRISLSAEKSITLVIAFSYQQLNRYFLYGMNYKKLTFRTGDDRKSNSMKIQF